MTDARQSDPIEVHRAAGAAEFVELMRRLKERSGLTFRQIEERAAADGDVLARSTLADTLRRPGLPKAEVVAALVRACGEGGRVDAWLAARQRLADAARRAPEPGRAPGPAPAADGTPGARPDGPTGPTGPTDPSADPPGGPVDPAATAPPPAGAPAPTADSTAADTPAGPPAGTPAGAGAARPRRRPLLAVGAAALAAAAVGTALVLLPDGDGGAKPAAAPPATAGPGPAVGEVRIRPAAAPGLCVTEGRDRAGRHSSAVAAQRPCDRAVPPRTVLEAVDSGLYRIRWIHPEFGEGCLKVLRTGAAAGLLEPWDDCMAASRFRIEGVPGATPETYRIRTPGDGSFCVGVADGPGGPAAEGVEVVEQPCADGAARQHFLIGPS